MSNITIGLYGGLGNRLHCLYSCHYLTITHGISFKYFWPNNINIRCDPEDLFEPNQLEFVDHIDENALKITGDLKKTDLDRNLFFHTPYSLKYEDHTADQEGRKLAYKNIRINKNIIEKVNSVVLPEKIIGVHVRGGDIKKGQKDKQDKREYVPPSRFIGIINSYPELKFFLSCENQEDEIEIYKNCNPNNIIKFEHSSYNRDTLDGVICGFINMMLLSRCKKILGMPSSFTMISCIMGDAVKIDVYPKS